MDDYGIITLFFERSEQAIAELRQKYDRAVKALARNILGNAQDAEECADDTYLGVWNTVPPEVPDSLKAYTLGLARNISLSRYHANTAKKRNSFYDTALDELESCLAAPGGPEQELEARELAAAIDRFLAGLPREDRQMFVCRYYFAEPLSAIAGKLGLKSGRVSMRLFRTREKLRKFLEKEGLLG